MKNKSAVYPVFSTSVDNGLAPGVDGLSNNGYYSNPDEVQVNRSKEGTPQSKAGDLDPWDLVPISMQNSDGPAWKDMSSKQMVLAVLKNTLKISVAICLLYLFVCSLNFLSNSFRLIAGRTTGSVLQNEYISNPIVGLMIGILVTVLVQSSSTSTSIIVSMVNASILSVHSAVPMIMGSNIGTSVTNTIVSLTQVGDRNVFRRAFAGATVHDMFNWLSVFVLLTTEIATGLLESVTLRIVDTADWSQAKGGKLRLLKVITDPFTKTVIQVDKNVLKHWSHNDPDYVNASLIKKSCKGGPCDFLFADTTMSDQTVGLILLFFSLLLLCICLILIVKILSSIMKGSIAQIIKVALNADIPYVPWLTGYIAIAIGAVMTVLVQSSSIFTSTITPLIGLGLISVDRSYPLTLGSNIGTTTTALLASMAGHDEGRKSSVQIALVHLLFNILGIMIFYPIPFMRFPIPLAKALGNITANYRWFAIFYLIAMFLLLPGFVFALSLGGTIALYCVGVPILVLFALIVLLNVLQNKIPDRLPAKLQNWNFLPLPLRSLEPYDKILTSSPCCSSCRKDEMDELSLPATVVRGTNQASMNIKNAENGGVTLVQSKTLFPVAPLYSSQNELKPMPEEKMRKSDQSEGHVNPTLEVERM
uniref:Sodium-dependent phosphate transporter n=3 Tax=Hirondellea gigas TaxID=1518452 RepID=A0A6A7FVX6_9CRUS